MATDFKVLFLLNPKVVFLNHGSFGACPKPVFETYQRWQAELERQPVEFLGRRAEDLMAEARATLARYLGSDVDEVVYFPNPTTALNMVARSMDLQAGDEILSTDHEYGAMERTWRFLCRKRGARYVRQPIPLPLSSSEDFEEIFWKGVTENTRAIFISHITSPTALRFPVKKICRRARETGLLCIVDGAHAPGQIPLNLQELGVDFYAGACHKWLCAPKGAAFLYARRELQPMLEPLVVSWGWEADRPSASRFVDHHEWQGTRDLAAFLSVPAAIEFQLEHDWDAVRKHLHQLVNETRQRINDLTGLEPICLDSTDGRLQMFAARLPDVNLLDLNKRLYEEFRIEVLIDSWNEQPLIRVSLQAYNDANDADVLLKALDKLLRELSAT
jgi:isopenicillin-N epimerase